MSRFKAGDLVVVEIYRVDRDADTHRPVYTSRVPDGLMDMQKTDEMAELLTDYTKPLTDKIERQARSINSLLHKIAELKTENAELKEKLHEEHYELVWQDGYSQGVSNEAEKWNENVKIIRDKAFEAGQVKGQNEAWELAGKIFDMDPSDIEKIFIKEGMWNLGSVLNNYAYTEAAAKVAEWERQNEICVGDIVHVENIHGTDGIVTCVDGCNITLMLKSGVAVCRNKNACHKTGRHIDVNALLKQIGGGENEE